jgi:cation diffusion facilitator CzcD-associated flavoprotein CzcO
MVKLIYRFSGLCAAIQVKKQLGIKAQIFELSSEVGGTWHANTYPGCACDIPSPLYSFSFELNPSKNKHVLFSSGLTCHL